MLYRLLLFVLCIGMTACSSSTSKEGTNTSSAAEAPVSSAEDHFADKVVIEFAQHFSVSYHGNYKVVQTDATFYPNGKNGKEEDRKDILVLVQKGTEAPPLEGALKGATILSIPAKTVAVNVQHSESFLRELELVDRINAIGGLYSYNDEMRNKALSNQIGQVGYSWHSPPNLEVLLERQPDLFLMTTASMAHTESLDKCRQLGVPTAAVFDWAEQDYLARAEWLKFYALFFNAEAKANEVFQNIADRIEELKGLAAQTPKESALWGFYTSKSQWAVDLASFPAQYMRDANLNNVLVGKVEANANGKQRLSSEQLLTMGKEAEHWIIGDIHAAPLPKESIMSSFQAWNTGNLYQNMERVDPKSNTSDWYATAIVRPDTVLADLIKLVHPELLPAYQPVFMGHYDKQRPLSSR
ncbi:MAG: ABC transporter substrate-binding protein [Bacteroidota bacterium]